MREFRGSARVAVAAPAAECFALTLDVGRYPTWCPDVVSRAEVIECADDGTPELVGATVHLGVGPLQRDFELMIAVAAEPERLVRLSRADSHPSAPELWMTWQIAAGRATQLRLELGGRIDASRLLPLGAVGDAVAQRLVAAARQALERPAG